MTAINLLIVLALTWLSVTVINWLVPPTDARRQTLLTIVLLAVYFVWVIGVPVLTTR